jgi:hypothetical protein
MSPCSRSDRKIPSTRRAKQPGEARLSHAQRKLAEILTVADEEVEGVQHDLIVMLSGVQPVEIRDAVGAEQHGLTIKDE